MRRMTNGLLVLAAVLATGAADLTAQQARGGRGLGMRGSGHEGRGGPGIERIMAMRDRLELTEDQVAQLDQFRQAGVARRSAIQARMSELRSQLASGQIERSEMMAAREDFQKGGQAIAEQHREQLEAILTEGQRETLGTMRRQGRAFAAGRMSARRGGRGQGGQAMRQGRRGHGGQGMRGQRSGMRGQRPAMRGQGRGMRGERMRGMRRGRGGDDMGGPGGIGRTPPPDTSGIGSR